MASNERRDARGVGIAYHPFLNGALLASPAAYDFVELPLDSYMNEAQRALLDPQLGRVKAVAAQKPCTWRGSALSLASATPAAAGVDRKMAELVAATGAGRLREELAFRRVDGRDLGVPQRPSLTAGVVALVAGRLAALGSDLDCPVAVGIPLHAFADPRGAAFLEGLAQATACSFSLDIEPQALSVDPTALRRAVAGRVAEVSLSTTGRVDPAAWALLDALLGMTGARAVVIRRTRNLFPLDEIMADIARAREALARVGAGCDAPARAAAVARPPEQREGDIAAAEREQRAFADLCLRAGASDAPPEAAAVEAQSAWRERVADVHRARQLAQWAQRPVSWRV